MMKPAAKNFSAYSKRYPALARRALKQVRTRLKRVLPRSAKEKICYGIPTFTYHGNLLHFGVYETHLGFYPGAAAVAAFRSKLKGFKTSKGTVQFPLDRPIPLTLVEKIARFCVQEREKTLD